MGFYTPWINLKNLYENVCQFLLRQCSEHGSDLMHLDSESMDKLTTTILDGLVTAIGNPALPAFFHLGIYQRQESNKYYLRNGHHM